MVAAFGKPVQRGHDGCGPCVILSFFPVPKISTVIGCGRSRTKARLVPFPERVLYFVQAVGLEGDRRAREVLVNDGPAQTDGIEELCAVVGPHRGDAHAGDAFQKSALQRPDIIERCLLVGKFYSAFFTKVVDGLEGERGTYGRGPVPDEAGHVVLVPCLACLHDQARPICHLLSQEPLERRGDREEGRYRQTISGNAGIVQDDDLGAFARRMENALLECFDGLGKVRSCFRIGQGDPLYREGLLRLDRPELVLAQYG